MPRHARYVVPGVPLHVTQRGVNKTACFGDDADRFLFVRLIEEAAARADSAVHAYVLMTNHVHLVITPETEKAPAHLMKRACQIYSQHFNRKYKRTGTLWEGRYKSSLIDTEQYLMRCYRYVELNPVRSGLAAVPGEYRWSSFASNGLGQPCEWLEPHPLYVALGSSAEERARAYQSFVAEGIGAAELHAIRIATRGGFPLGGEEFVTRINKEFGVQFRRGRAAVTQEEKVVCPRF